MADSAASELVQLNESTQRFLSSPLKMLIGNEWVDAASGESTAVENPATGKVIATVPSAGAADVDRAVQAARQAFESDAWALMQPSERERLMLRIADLIDLHGQELSELETLDNGKSIVMARRVDVASTANFFRYMAGWATKIEGSTVNVSLPKRKPQNYFAFTRKEPVGVVAGIIPWNFPLSMAAYKIAPALATGCTIVLKPAEETPLSALRLGQIIIEAGCPKGVVNIVTGVGEVAGAALASHPGVNKVAFTGSTSVGKLIGHAAIENMSRLTLELGGKSPVIVFDDAGDLEAVAAGAASAAFFNHGQTCTAGSRLYVHKDIYEPLVDRVCNIAKTMRLGDGFNPKATMGPLISAKHLDRVSSYVSAGISEGAVVRTGGARAERAGYFMEPTVLVDTTHDMTPVQNEIFGPVLVAIPFSDVEEVTQQANGTSYGLGASIWSNNLSRVHRMIPRLNVGMVWVNSHNLIDPALPFGGTKQSGYGRELGNSVLDMYTETKSVCMLV